MSKLIAAAVLALLWTAVAAAGQATLGRAINLNEPGALEALQHSNPTHYEKVRKIMKGLFSGQTPPFLIGYRQISTRAT